MHNANSEGVFLLKTLIALFACVALGACNQRSVEFRQVYLGQNGPMAPQVTYVKDRLFLDKSWIKSALTEAEFHTLRSKVDFDTELLVAIALGERKSASGSIKIRSVYLYTGVPTWPLNINAQAGVIGSGCKNRDRVSSPFTLLILKKPEKFQLPGGYDIQNFEEGCPSE